MPPRSRGCRVCVRRRVKCDATRPVCLRCQKAGLDCDGPPAPPSTFQDETEAVTQRFASRSGSTMSDSTAPSSSRSAPSSVAMHSDPFPPARMPSSPDPFNDDAYCGFFIANYFNVGVSFADHQDQRDWMVHCFQHPAELPVANLAARCLFTCYFGRANARPDLETEAKYLYGGALTELRARLSSDLPHSAGSRQFDTVSAVALLILFEYMAFTSKEGWMQHVLGMRALFEMLGPSYFHDGPARALFTLARGPCIDASIAYCERSFLEQDQWHWPNPSRDRYSTQFDLLNRICARFPGLIEDVEELVGDDDHADPVHTQRVLRTYNAWVGVLAELRSWHNSWTADMGSDVPRAEAVDRDTLEGASLPMDATTSYSNALVASSFCQYHAFTVTVHNWLQKLHATHADTTFAYVDVSFDADDSRHTIERHAALLCQSLPYLLSWEGAHAAKFPMLSHIRTAYLAMPPASDTARWLEQVLEMLADVNGIKMARHMLSGVRQRSTPMAEDERRPGWYLPVSWRDCSEPV